MAVVGTLDYNPTFYSDGVKNNFSAGLGVNINLGTVVKKPTPSEDNHSYHTTENPGCQASKVVKELKVNLKWIEETANSIEEVANKIPRIEAKVFIRPEVAVRQGEECCSKNKPPATWTEIKGGVEGGFEVNYNCLGIPDLNYSIKLWPVLIIAEFKCKIFIGPTGKIALEPVGKFYGDLFGEKRPDCKACFYWNIKGECFIRAGVKAGGKVNVYHWHPFGKGEAGFDVTGEPDESLEVTGEASAGIGVTLTGTYAPGEDCQKPEPGLHGVYNLGKGKANLKITIKLGPLSFDPSYEIKLCDGAEYVF